MGERKSFVLYFDWEESLATLNDEQAGALLRAMFAYNKRGQLYAGADPAVAASFGFCRSAFDRDRKKYQAKCKRLAANARKGGLAKACKCCQIERNNDNANDNDNDNDNDSLASPVAALPVAAAEARSEAEVPLDGGGEFEWLFERCRTVTGISPTGDEQRELVGWYQEYGQEKLEQLFDEAAKHKARRFGYLRAIMRRWAETGFPKPKRCMGPEQARGCQAVPPDEVKANGEELAALLAATEWLEEGQDG